MRKYISVLIILLVGNCYGVKAKKDSVLEKYFGHEVSDPYRWLEDENNGQVKDWVSKQGLAADEYLSQITMRDQIKKRLTDIYNTSRYGLPLKKGQYLYYHKNSGLQPHDIFIRQKIGEDIKKETQIVLDPNTMSLDGSIAAFPAGFSLDHKYMAYSIQESGSDWNIIKIRDLNTLEDLDDQIKWVKFSGACWGEGGFYYLRFPKPKDKLTQSNKNAAIYYHQLGSGQESDQLIYQNKSDPNYLYGMQTVAKGRFLIIYESRGTHGHRVLYKDLLKNDDIQTLIDSTDHNHAVITYRQGSFLLYTDQRAPNFRLVKIDPGDPKEDKWVNIIDENKKNKLENVTLVGDKLIAKYLVDVCAAIQRYDLSGKFEGEIVLPGIGNVSNFSVGEEGDTQAYYWFESYTTPRIIFNYDVLKNKSTTFHKAKVKVDIDNYLTEQVFYKSIDGTKIPMFLVYKKGLKKDSSNPVLLYGYGGFNIVSSPNFSIERFALMEQGVILAYANIRGGGEYGEEWHKAGNKFNKQNVFDDFIAGAEFLIEQKYTRANKLAINGRSNGGLLVGAVMTMRPDLMKVAIPEVGVLDMLRYQHFTIGHAWVKEYGSSEESEKMFKYLYGYSPLHNVKENVNYPATLIMTSDHDDRVVPAHSFKFAATLKEKYRGENPILLRVERKAGHGVGISVQQLISELADKYAFILYYTSSGITAGR